MLPLLLAAAQALTPDSAAEIRALDLKAHITFLASDELEGRESGERGRHLAAEYFARHWERLGLKPIDPEGEYLLPFNTAGKRCYNTAGLLSGTDPTFADQVLVIGGHHDHAGIGGPGAMGGPGEIHNGADDNASGSSGVAELAEWFVEHPLRRPILFMTFSAEERGLVGSKKFVQSGVLPVERMYAMINLDMIGRSVDDYLFIGGLGTAEEFHDILDGVLERSGFALETSDEGEAPSDNTSFYNAGVPALFFFTNIHKDYHLPEDDADKINYDGAVKVLELVRKTAQALDGWSRRLTYEEVPGMGMPADFMQRNLEHFRRIEERRSQKGKLGLKVEEVSDAGPVVSSVREGSAADLAGLLEGDVLVTVEGVRVRTKADLRRALGGRKKGEEVRVAVRRNDANLELVATLQ